MLDVILIYKVWENISRKVFCTYEQLRCIHNHYIPSAAYRFATALRKYSHSFLDQWKFFNVSFKKCFFIK